MTNTSHSFEREDMTELFCIVANICRPDHSYLGQDAYPMSKDEVHETWKQSRSSYNASCGPRQNKDVSHHKTRKYKAKFAVDIEYFNRKSIERILTVIIHEVAHLAEGYHTEGSSHNPAFWQTYIENAKHILDNMHRMEIWFGERFIDREEFIDELREDPNSSMVDKRMETVSERKNKIEKELKEHINN